MRPKRPKILYTYNVFHELEKHEMSEECVPEIVGKDPAIASQTPEGTYWRCRSDGACRHDFYGWDKLKAARAAEVWATRSDIAKLQKHLEDLTKKEEAAKDD